MNPHGLLTLVECKLWRNPEARRKVVSQVLDYARSVASWDYADLQRQVSIATGESGNVPFQRVHEQFPELEEQRFVDAVSRSMQAGRFLVLIAGNGIREDVGALTSLINRNAALGYTFAMFEVALYEWGSTLAIQPRVVTQTRNLERTIVVVREQSGRVGFHEQTDDLPEAALSMGKLATDLQPWWDPLLETIAFDDPEQEPPKYVHPNTIRALLPAPHVWISAYRSPPRCGVYLGGKVEILQGLIRQLNADDILAQIPKGSKGPGDRDERPFIVTRKEEEFSSKEEEQTWLADAMNQFVNAIRPAIQAVDP